ncbi:hypothetical protein ACQPXH_07280 [Nocardia sp. CA-135953]|uniref:hypothetical protein n=1 Tax=Nocardia sp. CA-135953 TaxID=3239978 RepID=UPI003D966C92
MDRAVGSGARTTALGQEGEGADHSYALRPSSCGAACSTLSGYNRSFSSAARARRSATVG